MNQKLDPVFRDILNALMPPDTGPNACARDAMYAPITSRAQQLALAADRQYIDAATARIRELEELVAYQKLSIDELTAKLSVMPKVPDALEKLHWAYYELRPNQYIGGARADAESTRQFIGQVIELLGGDTP